MKIGKCLLSMLLTMMILVGTMSVGVSAKSNFVGDSEASEDDINVSSDVDDSIVPKTSEFTTEADKNQSVDDMGGTTESEELNEENFDFTIDGIKYTVNRDGTTVTISGYENVSGDLTINNEVEYGSKRYSVTSIGNYAFNGCSGLTSIKIPDSVTSIGYSTFYNCSSLTSVTIPSTVKKIDSSVFSSCSKLVTAGPSNSTEKNYNIEFGWTESIPSNAFSDCSSLTSIEIPDSVTSIGKYAFCNCSGLTSIKIPDGVTSIEECTFSGCSSLTSMTIPSNVTEIGLNVFSGCSKLTTAGPSNSTKKNYDIEFGWTESILSNAFSGCSSLTSIEIPDSVTSIGTYAFQNCSTLNSIEIPDGVTSIEDGTFNRCSSLTSIEIPDSVTSIGKYAFSGCSSLTSVTIPSDVTSIGDNAFNGCSSLTSVEIPNKVTSIEAYAFNRCSSLTSVEIPNTVTNIGTYAFYRCSGLTSIKIPYGVTSIEESTFNGCSSLTSVEIPNTVTSIGNSTFSGCSRLTSVTIPSGVTSIGNSAFNGCSSLTSVEIPNKVTSIGLSAFQNCSSLTSIEIPDGVTSIGISAFYYCSSLTSVTIHSGVTSIEAYAFNGCSSLTSVTIPNTVTSIGTRVFQNCSSLNDIIFLGTKPAIGSSAFSRLTFNLHYPIGYGTNWDPTETTLGDATCITYVGQQTPSSPENFKNVLENTDIKEINVSSNINFESETPGLLELKGSEKKLFVADNVTIDLKNNAIQVPENSNLTIEGGTIKKTTTSANSSTNFYSNSDAVSPFDMYENGSLTASNEVDYIKDGTAIYTKPNGQLELKGVTFEGNEMLFSAVYNSGDLTVKDCNFSNNHAKWTEAMGNKPWGGSCIYNKGIATVTNSTFTDNRADYYCGAVYNIKTMTLDNCTFTGNYAPYAGAIYDNTGGADTGFNGKLTMKDCKVTDNTAGHQGAVLVRNDAEITFDGKNIISNNKVNGKKCNLFLAYTIDNPNIPLKFIVKDTFDESNSEIGITVQKPSNDSIICDSYDKEQFNCFKYDSDNFTIEKDTNNKLILKQNVSSDDIEISKNDWYIELKSNEI